MGYYTRFDGSFEITPPLKEDHYKFLFYWLKQDFIHAKVESIGKDGAWLVPIEREDRELCKKCEHELKCTLDNIMPMQKRCVKYDKNILKPDGNDTNVNPISYKDLPHNWCQMALISKAEITMGWQGGTLESPSSDQEVKSSRNEQHWVKFLIDKFFKPLGYKLHGVIMGDGEESEDKWELEITEAQDVQRWALSLQRAGLDDECSDYKLGLQRFSYEEKRHIDGEIPEITEQTISKTLSGVAYE